MEAVISYGIQKEVNYARIDGVIMASKAMKKLP